MQLTAELFQQIVVGLRSDERNASKHGKRREGRVGVRYSAELAIPVGNGTEKKAAKLMVRTVMIRDVSPSGMGFTSHDKMNVGLEIVCSLTDAAGEITEIPMRIQHCTQVTKDLYIVGAHFLPTALAAGARPAIASEPDRGKSELTQLLYISDATAQMSRLELQSLIATCRRKNSASNLTGLLLYSSGHFIQLLEGDWPVLAKLLCIISSDARHINVRQVYLGPCDKRLYPTWDMGLLNVDDFTGLDRIALLEGIDLLKKQPDAATILEVFRRFTEQLKKKEDPAALGA